MGARRSARSAAVTILGIALLAGCAEPAILDLPGQSAQPISAVGSSFFPDSKIWVTPVAADAPTDPSSSTYITTLSTFKPVVTLRDFAVPVFVADATSPRFSITPTAPGAPPGFKVQKVPIPSFVTVDSANNRNMAILDPTDRCVYEMYQAGKTTQGWTADWVNALPSDGDGVYPDGLSVRASGFPNTAGLVWPDELRSGRIPHALLFAFPLTGAGGPVAPATESNGRTTSSDALPMGARLALDPTLDLATLGLTPAELTIAKALQEYGMILGDTSDGFTLYAADPRSFPADPYASTWGTVTYADISRIPFSRMRVLDLGPRVPDTIRRPMMNRCSNGASGG
jgi:hypothetical protein